MRIGLKIRGAITTSAFVTLTAASTGSLAQEGVETPRAADGRPDLSGTWDNGAGIDFLQPKQVGASICLVDCPEIESEAAGGHRPPLDRPSYRPEFQAKVDDLNRRQVEEDPVLQCRNPGLPRIGPPDKIVQTPSEIVFLYDDVNGNYFRVIPVDGRGHRMDVEPSYLGDAVGRWEGDTLVIESINFNDDSWLIDDGSFHTTDLRVVERITRNGNELEWRAVAHDPAVLAEPWQKQPRTARLTDVEIVEAPPCIERDLPLMQDLSSHDNNR